MPLGSSVSYDADATHQRVTNRQWVDQVTVHKYGLQGFPRRRFRIGNLAQTHLKLARAEINPPGLSQLEPREGYVRVQREANVTQYGDRRLHRRYRNRLISEAGTQVTIGGRILPT
jgi:hypothetical protein